MHFPNQHFKNTLPAEVALFFFLYHSRRAYASLFSSRCLLALRAAARRNPAMTRRQDCQQCKTLCCECQKVANYLQRARPYSAAAVQECFADEKAQEMPFSVCGWAESGGGRRPTGAESDHRMKRKLFRELSRDHRKCPGNSQPPLYAAATARRAEYKRHHESGERPGGSPYSWLAPGYCSE